jgi:hypothetical protein
MYQKLDAILTMQPEKNPPQHLSDCFVNESSGVRTLASLFMFFGLG